MEVNQICLLPGFGFHPTDEELVGYYLKRKVHGHEIKGDVIPEVDIYDYEPWDLAEIACLPSKDQRWHFFCRRDRKYPKGSRTKRATRAGYWKSTGNDRNVTRTHRSVRRTIGTKKSLVFHRGRAPFGQRTDWVMHEYKLEKGECEEAGLQDTFVLCCVFKKKNGGKRDEIKNSPTDSMPKGSAQSLPGRKEVNNGKEDLQTFEDDIDKWVEMLIDCPDDDECPNLDLTPPSDGFKKIN